MGAVGRGWVMRRTSTSRHRSLRAVRRDIAVLAVAATASISLGTWLHGQRCRSGATPAPAVSASKLAEPGCDESDVGVAVDVTPIERPALPAAGALDYGEAFSFVIDLDGPHVVLATTVDPAWAKGRASLDAEVRAWRAVQTNALPESLRNARGRKVSLYGTPTSGVPTVLSGATIGAPRLVSRAAGELYDGETRLLETWQLHERLQQDGLPPSLADKAARVVWDEGAQLLVAPLRGAEIEGATWARSTALPPPVFYVQTTLNSGDEGSMQAALLATPQGRESADYFREIEGGSLAESLRTRGWVDPAGNLALATTFVDSPLIGGCGGFEIPLSNSAFVHAGLHTMPRNLPTAHSVAPALVADLNLDGYPDLVMTGDEVATSDVLLAGGPDGHVRVDALQAVPFFGCPC